MTAPEEAVTAATQAIIAVAYDFGHGNYVGGDAGKFARAAVEAAAPHILAAEHQRTGSCAECGSHLALAQPEVYWCGTCHHACLRPRPALGPVPQGAR